MDKKQIISFLFILQNDCCPSELLLFARVFSHFVERVDGKNIRFAGIDVGTVKSVYFINDTIMEVKMVIDKKGKNIIKKNALVYIGTDGLVGNKVVNILSVKTDAPYAVENDIIPSKKPVDTDEMMRTLSKTNNQISKIAEDFSTSINKLNSSEGLWQLLNDRTIADNINDASFQVKKSN